MIKPDSLFIQKGEKQEGLQTKLLRAFAYGKQDDINSCREEFLQTYPGDAGGIELLFATVKTLKEASILPGSQSTDPEGSRLLISKSENTQNFAKYILKNSGNRKFLKQFWGYLQKTARWANIEDLFVKFKHNLITEVAAYRALSYAGVCPVFADPEEDILMAVDIKIRDGRDFVQVKGSPISDVFIVSSLDMSILKVQEIVKLIPEGLESGAGAFWKKVFDKFTEDTNFLETGLGRRVVSYLVVIPYGKCDFQTGEIEQETKELVLDYFRDH